MANLYGTELRRLRTKAEKSLKDVAEEIGVSITYVSDVERGLRKPFADDITSQIERFLGVPRSTLVTLAQRDRLKWDHPDVPDQGIAEVQRVLDKWRTMEVD